MPFTYKKIPQDETYEATSRRENREMRVRADYEDMIKDALKAIRVEKPADFRLAVLDLEKILVSASTDSRPDFDPQLKECMSRIYELYMQKDYNTQEPVRSVESPDNDCEYQQIIKEQIQIKIGDFNSFTDAQRHQYVTDQKETRDRAAQRQQAMAAGESKREEHTRTMAAESRAQQERLVREQRMIEAQIQRGRANVPMAGISALWLLASGMQAAANRRQLPGIDDPLLRNNPHRPSGEDIDATYRAFANALQQVPIITSEMPQARYVEEGGQILLGAGLDLDLMVSAGLTNRFFNVSSDVAELRLQFLRNFSDVVVCLIRDHSQSLEQVFRMCVTGNSNGERLPMLRDAMNRNDQTTITRYIQTWNQSPLEAAMLEELGNEEMSSSQPAARRSRLFQPETYADQANRILLDAGFSPDLLAAVNSMSIFRNNTPETAESKLEALRSFSDIAVSLIRDHGQSIERVFNICFNQEDSVIERLRNAIHVNDQVTIAQYIQRWGPVSFVD